MQHLETKNKAIKRLSKSDVKFCNQNTPTLYNSNITVGKGRFCESVWLTGMSLFQSHLRNLNEKLFEVSKLKLFKMHIGRMGET
jgi:hypothetical protein